MASKKEKVGSSLVLHPGYEPVLQGILEHHGDWDRLLILSDIAEEAGEYQLAITLKWMAEHKKWPRIHASISSTDPSPYYSWSNNWDSRDDSDGLRNLVNRCSCFVKTWLEAVQYLCKRLMEVRAVACIKGGHREVKYVKKIATKELARPQSQKREVHQESQGAQAGAQITRPGARRLAMLHLRRQARQRGWYG